MAGTLSFISQVVVPGLPFMTRISEKLGSQNLWIKVTEDVKTDVRAWCSFIQQKMVQPFTKMDYDVLPEFHTFTDAQG